MEKVLSWEEATKDIDPKVMAKAQRLASADMVKLMRADLEAKSIRIAELEAQLSLAHKEASVLALHLWEKYYKEDSPNFGLCGSVAGIITQIDNMTTGLVSEAQLKTAKEFTKMVAHVGVDFGYGKYMPTDTEIQAARDFLDSLEGKE